HLRVTARISSTSIEQLLTMLPLVCVTCATRAPVQPTVPVDERIVITPRILPVHDMNPANWSGQRQADLHFQPGGVLLQHEIPRKDFSQEFGRLTEWQDRDA